MHLINRIKELITPYEQDIVQPLVHRVHLVKRSFIVVDCEMGCDRKGLKRIIKGYLASGIYEKERIPLMIYYRENSNYAYEKIKPFLKKYESLRLKIWFYESPSLPFGLSIIGQNALAYINANRKFSELASIDERLVEHGTKVCMFHRDAYWSWMFPDMVLCDTKQEFCYFFKGLIE